MKTQTYSVASDGSWITCNICGRTSHNGNDVLNKYCVFCHFWLDQVQEALDSMQGPKKTYRGGRSLIGNTAWVTVSDGPSIEDEHALDPNPSQEVCNHSPDGFEWGYGGSGPAQLALALLLDVDVPEERAVQLYQQFKAEVIAKLPKDGWEMTSEDINFWLFKAGVRWAREQMVDKGVNQEDSRTE